MTFLLLLESRKQYRLEKDTRQFLKNLLILSGTDEETSADPDTIGDFLKKLPSENLENLPPLLVNHLIRIKALDDYRFRGRFLIAIDGTGIHTYSKRHCDKLRYFPILSIFMAMTCLKCSYYIDSPLRMF